MEGKKDNKPMHPLINDYNINEIYLVKYVEDTPDNELYHP